MICLTVVIAIISLASAHVVFTPINTAPAGDDSTVLQLEVEHVFSGYGLQSLTLKIPQGVQIVRPEIQVGYVISFTYRPLPSYNWYFDDDSGLGNVTYVADTVTWTAQNNADDVPNVDIETFEMQITLGCLFNDSVTNTLWNNQYALWFNTIEYSVAVNSSITPPNHFQNWTAIASGTQDLQSMSFPSPYILINDWSACGSLTWFGQVIPSPTSTMQATSSTPVPSSAANYVTPAQLNSTAQSVLNTCQANITALAAMVIASQQAISALQAGSGNLASMPTQDHGIAVAAIICSVFGFVFGLLGAGVALLISRRHTALDKA